MRILAQRISRRLGMSVIAALAAAVVAAQETEVQALREQNRLLAEQVRAQQRQIDELRTRLDRLDDGPAPAAPAVSETGRQIRLSGEVGIGYFDSGRDGHAPNAEFRVDDARLFVEASVWRNVYFFGGLEITTREANDEFFHAGEIYVDVENLWSAGRDATLSLRAGRFNIPFGEEYLVRNVMDNPLVSHSLSDLWGIDEGLQIYGTLGRVRYNLALQNGGHKSLRDFDSDKALVARLAWEASPRLSFSASAMRTGDLTVAGDSVSEVWFANAFFRALGPAATTRNFSVELAEFDAAWRWSGGHLKAAAGWVGFDDDSTSGDFSRNLSYYSVEGLQRLTERLSAAVRYSTIDAPGGYLIAGQGSAGRFFYSPAAPHTEELSRLSVGLGYRFAPPLVWKVEYSWEDGELVGGAKRGATELVSSILGVRF